MQLFRRNLIALTSLLVLLPIRAARSQPLSRRLRGQVLSVGADAVVIKTSEGETVRLKPAQTTRWIEVLPASMDKIEPGLFIGTTALPQPDGTLVASEVHLFPESMRGLGEGHRPLDTGTASTMTNATVANVEAVKKRPGTMTNATVAKVDSASGSRRLTLKYNGGEKSVLVPANTPVVQYAAGDRGLLRVGAHLFTVAAGSADGAWVPVFIMIGRDGLVPPM